MPVAVEALHTFGVLPLLTWLIQGAIGPALIGLPVTWAATDLADAARKWFRRLRRSDGLSRIVQAAADGLGLSGAEFIAVRQLLESESTWVEVGRGSVEDLAALIADCLPGRAGEGPLAAGRAVAGGLLEFAVRDLEPEWFRQVLFSRLERMQADQATALDQAMLSVHADLAALLAHQDVADAGRFAQVMGQLGRVLDRLAPVPADQGEVAVYLVRLIRWLATAPWPQDARFAGPTLSPAAIERQLRIASDRGPDEPDLDADDLARRCVRLVVLGGPGTGKTWLARRTARLCAEAALNALAAGAVPDEVELPLYATCAQLAAAAPDAGIRRVIVASALGQLPDLGGSRAAEALRTLFEERDAPTLLALDSLDEARGADDRICQADTLPPAWRIVLTSRPASWGNQLAVGAGDPTRKVGSLRPLSYPEDVEAVIVGWFSERPEWAADLTAQLRRRPALQQAATEPLILAFYCIIGGGQRLPGRRGDLYAKVIRRMLTGRWRGSGDRDPDPDACLETLRDWAWSAAVRDPVSGLGAWADEFPTPRVRQSPDDRDAMDHVAVPTGPPDVDKGMTQRRFVHRSLREHLVAEHVALRMPAEEAARELLHHLWYDPDWEHTAPAALAMHPQRDQVLKDLIGCVTRGDQLGVDLAVIDRCWELRRFLARVALESGEDDWMPEVAETIARARLDLATAGHVDTWNGLIREVAGVEWPTSNRLIRESLLAQLAGETHPWTALGLAAAIARLAVTAEERTQARQLLLTLLAWPTGHEIAQSLAELVAGLDPTAEERARAREALLAPLARSTNPEKARDLAPTIARLAVTAEEQAQAREALLAMLTRATDPRVCLGLAAALARLSVTAEEQAQVRETLLALLARPSILWPGRDLAAAVARLSVSPEERARAREVLFALLAVLDGTEAPALAEVVSGLDPTGQERAQAREALLTLLAGATDPFRDLGLAAAVARLSVSAEEQAQAREALLTLLPGKTHPHMAQDLGEVVSGLDPTGQERAQARRALLTLLARSTDLARAWYLAPTVARLSVTPEDQAQAREALLTLLVGEAHPRTARDLAEVISGLDPTDQERAQARERLLAMLSQATHPWKANGLDPAVARLAVTAEDQAQARESLLASPISPEMASDLAEAIARLDPTEQERTLAREELLVRIDRVTIDSRIARNLVATVFRLTVTTEDRAQAREALLALLASSPHDPWRVQCLAEAVAGLDPSEEERARAQKALLPWLSNAPDAGIAEDLAAAALRLAITSEERARTRRALFALRAGATSSHRASGLTRVVAGLNPTIADLGGSGGWPYPPTQELLAAARQNTGLSAWLADLPLLYCG
jgi:NACHT domain